CQTADLGDQLSFGDQHSRSRSMPPILSEAHFSQKSREVKHPGSLSARCRSPALTLRLRSGNIARLALDAYPVAAPAEGFEWWGFALATCAKSILPCLRSARGA